MRGLSAPAPVGRRPPERPLAPWAVEARRSRFRSPYGWRGNVDWLRRYLLGPAGTPVGHTNFVPQATFEQPAPGPRVAFLGDLMPPRGRRLVVGPGLREFLAGADWLILNLEGVISRDRRVWNGLRHEPAILAFLEELFPPTRTVVGCANNHAADCGWNEFERSCARLERRGFTVIGRRDRPAVLLEDAVLVAACTDWSNQRGDYLARLEEANAALVPGTFPVLFPHWGSEFHLFPRRPQMARATRLLRRWGLIVGHHPHCPQPVVAHRGRLVAYSLGDLAFGTADRRFDHGIALRVACGQVAGGAWRVGRADWRFTRQLRRGDALVLDTAGDCPLFPPSAHGNNTVRSRATDPARR